MRTNKQEREYHKIKKANRQMHYDNVSEEEAIKNFSYEECMKLGYIQMGKRHPYYYGKDAVFTHSIGKNCQNETVLTAREFCSRLMKLKDRAFKEIKEMK